MFKPSTPEKIQYWKERILQQQNSDLKRWRIIWCQFMTLFLEIGIKAQLGDSG